jgi:hypothetical protein
MASSTPAPSRRRGSTDRERAVSRQTEAAEAVVYLTEEGRDISRLTPWELDFLDSLSTRLKAGWAGSLSEKQLDVIDRIWEKVDR